MDPLLWVKLEKKKIEGDTMADRYDTYSRLAKVISPLKKKLKRWKRRIWSLAIIVLVLTALGIGMQLKKDASKIADEQRRASWEAKETFMEMLQQEEGPSEATQQVMKQLTLGESMYEVVHRVQYVCGQQDVSLGKKNTAEIIRLLLDSPDWEASMNGERSVILTEQRNEMLDTCKENTYIGIDADGNLVLYEGKPKSERAVRTFFQLDVKSMESSLPPQVLKQLKDGIKISDIDEYNSVISTFSDYAVEYTSEVMKPTSMQ